MKIKFEFNFKTLWLFVSAILLALPVFVPSFPDSVIFFGDVMNLSLSILFVISFPLSLLGLPLSALLQNLWDVNPYSIQGLYLQVISFFVMGYLQWFVVAPRVMKKISLRIRELAVEECRGIMDGTNKTLPKAFNESGFTPLESVFNEKEEEKKNCITEKR